MSEDSATQDSRPSKLQFVREVCADAALALFATVVIGLVIASLAAAGIITMSLAYVLLGLAWVVAVGGSYLVPWPFPYKHRAIFAVLLALMLIGVGFYESEHYEKPPSAKEIAGEVSKLIAGLPSDTPRKADRLSEPTSSLPKTIQGAPTIPPVSEIIPLQSKAGKMIFRCLITPIPENRTLEQIQSDLKERINAARGTFGVSIEVSEILGGRKIVMLPSTDEGRLRMGGVERWTLEIRKSGPEALITSIIDLPEPLGSLSKSMPVDPKSDKLHSEHNGIEKLLGAPPNTCQVI